MAKENSESEQPSAPKAPSGLKKTFETFLCDKDRTVEGIEAMLMEHELLEPKYDPTLIINQSLAVNRLVDDEE